MEDRGVDWIFRFFVTWTGGAESEWTANELRFMGSNLNGFNEMNTKTLDIFYNFTPVAFV